MLQVGGQWKPSTNLPQIVFQLNHHVFSDKSFEEWEKYLHIFIGTSSTYHDQRKKQASKFIDRFFAVPIRLQHKLIVNFLKVIYI